MARDFSSQKRELENHGLNLFVHCGMILLPFTSFVPSNVASHKEIPKHDNLIFQLKTKLQILILGIGSVGLLSSYVSYSPEITVR